MSRRTAALFALALAPLGIPAPAAETDVVAVVACDPYADLKKQVRWFGTLVDQPMLDGFAESFLMPITNFKGLAGLDVGRPMGLVVTAGGDEPVIHACVPVKNLDKLLEAFQGVTGPVEEVDGVRRISPPGGMPLDVVEQDGWAIIGPQGAPPPVGDPTKLLGAVVDTFTVGAQAFPSRMPEAMRQRFQAMLDQAAAVAAAQGQQVDGAGIEEILKGLRETETLLVGVAIDPEAERVSIEMQNRMTAESKTADTVAAMAKAATTVATPTTADGKPPMLSLHLAAAVPEALRRGAIDGLAAIEAADEAGAATAMAILRQALAAMIESGGYDAALSVDTSGVGDDPQGRLPAVTAGMRVKDGAALEADVKKIVAAAGETPGLTVAFDTGKAAGANLHTITLDDIGMGAFAGVALPAEITLAVAPNYAFVLAGGDVPARLAAVAGASGKPDANVKPMADVNVALAPLLRYLAALGRAQDADSEEAAGMDAAANVADAQKSALVQLLVRPVERGTSLRLSADAGAIRTVAAGVKPQAGAAAPPMPATGGPDPIPFPMPVR